MGKMFLLWPDMKPRQSVDAVLVAISSPGAVLGSDSGLPLENLGIALLGRVLASQGFNVAICDGEGQRLNPASCRKAVLQCEAPFIGLTTFQASMTDILDLAASYKHRYPSATVCLGGTHASFCADEILQHELFVDCVVVGRGEPVIGLLVEDAQKGRSSRGVVSEHEIGNEATSLWVFRDSALTHQRKRAALMTSEGCLGNCSFCVTPQFEKLHSGPKWRPRPISDVVLEIRWLHKEFGVTHIHFHDADFLGRSNATLERARKIAHALIKLPFQVRVRFAAQARAVALAGDVFWSNWKRAGLERVFVGLESGHQSCLKQFRKWSRLEDNAVALKYLKRHGIAVQIGFIAFTPESTIQSVRVNVEYLKSLGQAHIFKNLSNPLRVYPGTADFERLDERGYLKYQKKHLDIQYSFISPEVAEIVEHVIRIRSEVYVLDKLQYDLDTGWSGGWNTIVTDFGSIDQDHAVELLHELQRRREKSILNAFEQALHGESGLAFNALLDRERATQQWVAYWLNARHRENATEIKNTEVYDAI